MQALLMLSGNQLGHQKYCKSSYLLMLLLGRSRFCLIFYLVIESYL